VHFWASEPDTGQAGLFAYLDECLPTCLSVCLSVCLPVCLPVYQPRCMGTFAYPARQHNDAVKPPCLGHARSAFKAATRALSVVPAGTMRSTMSAASRNRGSSPEELLYPGYCMDGEWIMNLGCG